MGELTSQAEVADGALFPADATDTGSSGYDHR
jgi:hypothetical protein